MKTGCYVMTMMTSNWRKASNPNHKSVYAKSLTVFWCLLVKSYFSIYLLVITSPYVNMEGKQRQRYYCRHVMLVVKRCGWGRREDESVLQERWRGYIFITFTSPFVSASKWMNVQDPSPHIIFAFSFSILMKVQNNMARAATSLLWFLFCKGGGEWWMWVRHSWKKMELGFSFHCWISFFLGKLIRTES